MANHSLLGISYRLELGSSFLPTLRRMWRCRMRGYFAQGKWQLVTTGIQLPPYTRLLYMHISILSVPPGMVLCENDRTLNGLALVTSVNPMGRWYSN